MDQSWKNRLLAVVCALALLTSCGGNVSLSGRTPTPSSPTAPGASGISPVQHVVVVVEENYSYEAVIGSASAPYLNDLAHRYSLAAGYYGNTHPSIGNYFMLTTGAIITNDDAFTGTVDSDNLARILKAAGKSWKVYAESLPSVGYLGGDSGPYLKHHNPFAYFSDVVNDPAQARNIVPFTQFASDLSSSSLPNYALVIPNDLNDAHTGSLAAADSWLKANIDPLVNNPSFQQSGLLLIVFDEGFFIDIQNGGGHVAAALVGGRVKQGYRSTIFYQHQSALRLTLDLLGVGQLPGAAAGAPSMAEFLQ